MERKNSSLSSRPFSYAFIAGLLLCGFAALLALSWNALFVIPGLFGLVLCVAENGMVRGSKTDVAIGIPMLAIAIATWLGFFAFILLKAAHLWP